MSHSVQHLMETGKAKNVSGVVKIRHGAFVLKLHNLHVGYYAENSRNVSSHRL